jgi:hypothetical protein
MISDKEKDKMMNLIPCSFIQQYSSFLSLSAIKYERRKRRRRNFSP